GLGLILGRKAFQNPFKEGIDLIHSVQNVYLEKGISLA
ncbi:MAG TPA: fructose-bisphosphate aldolase, partial [Aminobacterium sp.]|nr:fructose-bisphosphate aldolase [Aminobacterium sp.]